MAIAVDDGSTSAACAGTAGNAAYAAAVTGAPIATTPIAATPIATTLCAVASAAPDVFATLVAAISAIFTIPAADIVVRMGGGNPGKTRGKTPAVVEAWQNSSECHKAAYRQGRQSQQACPQVILLVNGVFFVVVQERRRGRQLGVNDGSAGGDFCVNLTYRSTDKGASYSPRA
ncbi:hypothetical protein [Sinorhizobium sp. NFACC03]|uniref:hypothetical protein n=1 Tax=Sinorhizobium sp. NFACC03 TaxID=1566295 RepID=UPI0015A33B14|nr:hypothetical protein [Sinorhizobium sp. NFACC03]